MGVRRPTSDLAVGDLPDRLEGFIAADITGLHTPHFRLGMTETGSNDLPQSCLNVSRLRLEHLGSERPSLYREFWLVETKRE